MQYLQELKSISLIKKHDETVFLAKSKLNKIEVLISKALFDSNISDDEFFFYK